MATIVVKVLNIRVYSDGDNIRYRVQFDTPFDGIVKNADGDYVEGQVDYIDFVPRFIIANCISFIDGLATLYTKKKEDGLRNGGQSGFGAAELQIVLRGAKVTLERTKFEAGDEYADNNGEIRTHEHAGYNTVITDIVVSDKIQAKLDALTDKILGL